MSNWSNSSWGEFIRSKEFALDRAAFLIAKSLQYKSLDIDDQLLILDSMGNELKDSIGGKERPTEIIASINEYLFDKHGFKGNNDDYYDPRNSYINDVIIRRTGIPITLSVLYIELARRTGFVLHGVGFPGHFLVKHVYHDFEIILDPFNKGRILTQEDLRHLLDQLYNGQVRLERRFFGSVTNEQILIRMLRNLKDAYMHSYDYDKALSATDMTIAIDLILQKSSGTGGSSFTRRDFTVTHCPTLRNTLKCSQMLTMLITYSSSCDIQSLFKHDMYG